MDDGICDERMDDAMRGVLLRHGATGLASLHGGLCRGFRDGLLLRYSALSSLAMISRVVRQSMRISFVKSISVISYVIYECKIKKVSQYTHHSKR